jgi:hypothetical protein
MTPRWRDPAQLGAIAVIALSLAYVIDNFRRTR